MNDLSLYVHVPFCARRCPYCSFYHVPWSQPRQAAFVEALEEEIRVTLGEMHPRVTLHTVFFGGGTPSTLSESVWERIFCALGPYLEDGAAKEITCELNPEDVNARLVSFFTEKGVNRISLGIQSMIPGAQQVLKRCPPDTNAKAIGLVTERISNVSFDVLLGVPGMSLQAFKSSMAQLTPLKPAHFSVYCLEPGECVAEGGPEFFDAVDQERTGDEYLWVCDRLSELGYRHYELSNFALPGRESLHNRCYWEGGEYVGLGPGAHSFVNGQRYHNPPSLRSYVAREWAVPGKGRIHDRRDSSALELERTMLALRTDRGLPLRWVRCPDEVFRDIVEDGLARLEADRLVLTDRGYLVMNDILLRLQTAGSDSTVTGGDRRFRTTADNDAV